MTDGSGRTRISIRVNIGGMAPRAGVTEDCGARLAQVRRIREEAGAQIENGLYEFLRSVTVNTTVTIINHEHYHKHNYIRDCITL